MFTGLIQDVGILETRQQQGHGANLVVKTKLDTHDWQLGESIAVQGACLTVTHISPHRFSADCSPETIDKTTLGALPIGSALHLERALRLGDRLGGHIVSGHVDGVGHIASMHTHQGIIELSIQIPEQLSRYTIVKGSIAIDGVSLTINDITRNLITISVIPHTQTSTRIPEYRIGTRINIEVDVIGKYIETLTSPWLSSSSNTKTSNIDGEFLKKHGFF
jgi:riboflavin synthase